MPHQIDPLIDRLGLSMWRVQRKIMSQMSLHKELGLTVPQMGLLNMIAKEKKSRVVQLAESMEVKSSAVTVMLDRLEVLGYIKREPDGKDRRAVVVTITEKGQQVLEEGHFRSKELLAEHLSILKPEELRNFAEYYRMIEDQER
ncbi:MULTISPECIES: MarR family transcriptional regulator [Paenibacillus]|uniref:MarR family winged helix-turn-helix transcriptional regulator n=1 Tax=Paenibacillus TaxID=44249 RepID=UPI0003E24D76|nr:MULTISPECIES: MarR family transcriptional regulator [Paenibacillus]ETT59453.1 MarR family transcriptional regulator [Paenibacillus sp. FSL H8-237]MEC0129387.1 MarR family transcriptional regulator [Paenibacillus odorifer]MEC0224152.1 MarR family transcriptional regulator [Paenibacillus odorifer]OZQ69231.1 MarR family transcriptional regulator [Paenibacillus odorifer]